MPGVITAGIVTEAGGLKASLTAHRKHQEDVANALLNISGIDTITGGPVDKDDPRAPYVHQPWPCAMYHPDGRYEVAATPKDMEELKTRGFRTEPYPRAQVAIGDPAAEKKELERKLKEKDGEIATLTDNLSKILARLEAIEKKGRAAA